MLLLPVRCLILLLLLNFVGSGWVQRKTKEHVRELQVHEAKQHVLMLMASRHQPAALVTEENIHQPLDHFDRQNNETFPQRFFVNEIFWQRPHGPVFLFIGGEGPISEFSVLAGHHVDMAEAHGALLVALEHRFYGNSINPDGLKTENLSYLSSQQALADLAAFHHNISERYNLSIKNKWISFGGSYPGALSAWFRGKFPHLVFGAVASSAPVRAKLDFSTYNKIVGLSLANEAVGGSDNCVADVRDAFDAVEAALRGGNASQVATDFNCCEIPKDLDDQIELMQNLADIVMGTVQYNEEMVVMSIDKLCDIMTNKSEEVYDRLVKLVEIYRFRIAEPCLDVSLEQTLKDLMNTSLESALKSERQWFYQTCTEFGYYQTCEVASCPFSRMLTLQAQTKLCSMLFHISQQSLPAHIAFTNSYYGEDHPRTHRVLYVNGGIDPWHGLSVVHNKTEDWDKDQAIFIEDTAHCADMGVNKATDRHTLKEARREIEMHVAKWLK
ncbi:thymus-specific serine protease [Polymixia lowei]